MSLYQISASVVGAGTDADVVGCFDPTLVLVRLRRAFPEVEIDPEDRAWRDFDAFKAREAAEGSSQALQRALRTAANDARRRGPIWTFRIPVAGGPKVFGRAERHDVSIWNSDAPIPEPLRSRFLAFLEELRFSDRVAVKSVRIDGNRETPA